MNFLLTREPSHGNAVRGVLSLADPRSPSSNGIPSLRSGIPTLENLNYLIPAGTYRIAVTWSPRFKRMLPLVVGVPKIVYSLSPSGERVPERAGERLGIRFHRGSVPEHSRGCILLRTAKELDTLTELIKQVPSTITIT